MSMKQKEISIQRKLMQMIMLTCGAVLVLTCAAFFTYEFLTYRDITKRELSTLGEIVAANSTSSLAFDNKEDADEILSALKAQKHLVAACLYDKEGKVFSTYPSNLPATSFPIPQGSGYSFSGAYLQGFEPVIQGSTRLGTLFLKSDMKGVNDRFILYGIIAFTFIILSFIFAYLLSRRLQKSISTPILELAETASIVSEQQDYSVRVTKKTNDEIGVLTDAFNHMLMQIEKQNEEIIALNLNLEQKVSKRTGELEGANTILKQQNEFIETIIDSSVDLIAVFDRQLHYLILNKQADEIYKLKREDIIGRHILDVFPTLKGSVMVQNLERALKGEFIRQDTYKSLVSDRYFENFFIPLKDKNNNTDRVLVIGHDITSIMWANEKLKTVNTDLEKSNRDLEQFAYVASHDLQEPLRKIQTFSELSEKNVQHPEILKRYLQKINSSAHRMSDLIKAVLNYSRLSKSENEWAPIDLNAIVDSIKTDLELLIEEKQAVITAAGLPVITGIPLQINQLFLNLISNSLKFSDAPPRITITANTVPGKQIKTESEINKKEDFTELVFSDNGIGFEQQYADRIFSIFQRLHSGPKYGGTGIGLALCKKIAENHGGAISVESEPGKGTRFFVYLPLNGQPKEPGTVKEPVFSDKD
jgi:PAS domain S-box-containing protein